MGAACATKGAKGIGFSLRSLRNPLRTLRFNLTAKHAKIYAEGAKLLLLAYASGSATGVSAKSSSIPFPLGSKIRRWKTNHHLFLLQFRLLRSQYLRQKSRMAVHPHLHLA